MEQFKKILVPTDGSEANDTVVEKSLYLARMLGARLKVLFVVDTSTFKGYPPDELITTLRGHMEAKGMEILDRVEKEGEELDVEVEKSLVHGKTDEMIIEESKDQDLIVIGTHGRSGLSRLFIGSTTERVVKHAECPVMVIHIKED